MLLRLAPWLFVSLWSTGYIAMKFAAPFAEPFTFLSVRFALVVAILAPFLLASGWWRIGWRDASAAFVVGSLMHGIYLGGIFWAIKQGMPASVAAIIISLQPLVSASLVAPILGERVEARHWLGLFLGLAGAVIVLLPGAKLDSAVIRVDMLLMSILALCSITVGTTLQKMWFAHVDVRASLLPQYVGACTVMALAAFLFEDRVLTWSVEAVAAMAWLVLVLSLGAISLFLMLLRRNEVWRTVTLFYLIPPFTAVTAWLLFDERLGMMQLLGMVLVVIAMLLASPATGGKATKAA
jgi:drug/metabolite transporter (DMT)-like permease